MNIVMVGLSHKSAPIEVREKVSFSDAHIASSLKQLLSYPSIHEAVILSTCNRMEIYCASISADAGVEDITRFLMKASGYTREQLSAHFFIKQGDQVVRHLFEVISSLDSIVLGEAQIQGQVRNAYQCAEEARTVSVLLHHLFRQALRVGKKVRSDTAIGANSVSVSTAAVKRAQQVLGDLSEHSILIIGAGEMAELTAQYLKDLGVHAVTVANRSFENARLLAERFDGTAVPFEEIGLHLAHSDIVISSTAAPGYVITAEMVHRAVRLRCGRPLLLIDIALPRDIDPECASESLESHVMVYDVDDMKDSIEANLQERALEVAQVQAIIEQQLDQFKQWYQSLFVQPTIKHIRKKADRIAQEEIQRALRIRGGASAEERAILEGLANAIVKKLLHGPTIRLVKQASHPDSYHITESARYLFGLDAFPDGKCGQTCESCSLAALHQCPTSVRSKRNA